MAINAIGAQPRIQTPPAGQRPADESLETTAPVRTTAAEATATAGHPGRSHVQQTLHLLDRVVRQKLQDALKSSDLDARQRHEVLETEKSFREDLQDVFHAASDGSTVDGGKLLVGVQESMQNLVDGLHITLDSLLPPVPWEAEMPPEMIPEEPTAPASPVPEVPPHLVPETVPQAGPSGLDALA